MYCLDSDILIAALRGDIAAKEKIIFMKQQGAVYITPISVFELFFGAYLSEQSASSYSIINPFL